MAQAATPVPVPASSPVVQKSAGIAAHWREYACEFAGTAILMLGMSIAIALLWGPGSPVPLIANIRLRLFVTGICCAGTATLVVYSALGRRSGGHINPAVTLAFWKLGNVRTPDAICYMVAQFLGAIVGTLPARIFGGKMALDPPALLTITTPGPWGWMAAFAGEVVITFLLMTLILKCINTPKLAKFTAALAGMLVVLLVTFEAPLSGTSLNPARSLAPALLLPMLKDQWLYCVAPPIGAVLAVVVAQHRWLRIPCVCGKLYHRAGDPCIFDCGYHLFHAGDVIMREGEPAEHAYVIEEGQVEVSRRDHHGQRVVLAQLGPRECIGEMALLLKKPRSATVVAVTDVQLRPFQHHNFAQVIARDPEASLRMLTQLGKRLYETDQRLAD